MACEKCPDGNKTEAAENESIAMLKYSIHHNHHHADELYELANTLDGEAREKVHAAVIDFENGNAKLEAALKLLEEG